MKEIKIKKSANTQAVPAFVSNNELFIKDTPESLNYSVIRVVTKDSLGYIRSKEGLREEVRDFWQAAVANGSTELGLTDYIEECVEYDESDPEEFFLKDTSDCDIFDNYPGLREEVDKIVESTGVEVGTWESSGAYPPTEKIQAVFIIED